MDKKTPLPLQEEGVWKLGEKLARQGLEHLLAKAGIPDIMIEEITRGEIKRSPEMAISLTFTLVVRRDDKGVIDTYTSLCRLRLRLHSENNQMETTVTPAYARYEGPAIAREYKGETRVHAIAMIPDPRYGINWDAIEFVSAPDYGCRTGS